MPVTQGKFVFTRHYLNAAFMNTQEVADKLIQLWREGKNAEAITLLYPADYKADTFLMSRNCRGEAAMLNRSQFTGMRVDAFHSLEINDPLVLEDYFCIGLEMDFTLRDAGRSVISESWVFVVREGKIVGERYFSG